MTNPKPNNFACPHEGCDKVYKDAAHLGIHRRAAHGVLGRSHKAKRMQDVKASLPQPAPITAETRTKRKYNKRSTSLATLPETATFQANGNGHYRPQTATRPFHAEAALAVAFGRFKELCTSVAVEYDLPPRSFAAKLIELIQSETLR